MTTCRKCSNALRETQEGYLAHRYADGSWLCFDCWLNDVDARSNPPVSPLTPRCECCRCDLPNLMEMEGDAYRLAEREGWVTQAREKLKETAAIPEADALYDRLAVLEQAIGSLEMQVEGYESDYPDEAQALKDAKALMDEANDEAANIKGSVASEEEHALALRAITTVSEMKRSPYFNMVEDKDDVDEDERSAEKEIRRYWRVQGLDEDAAATAAALEIAEARKG